MPAECPECGTPLRPMKEADSTCAAPTPQSAPRRCAAGSSTSARAAGSTSRRSARSRPRRSPSPTSREPPLVTEARLFALTLDQLLPIEVIVSDAETGLPKLDDDGVVRVRAPFRRNRDRRREEGRRTAGPEAVGQRDQAPRRARERQDEAAVAHARLAEHPARRPGRGAGARRLVRFARRDPRGFAEELAGSTASAASSPTSSWHGSGRLAPGDPRAWRQRGSSSRRPGIRVRAHPADDGGVLAGLTDRRHRQRSTASRARAPRGHPRGGRQGGLGSRRRPTTWRRARRRVQAAKAEELGIRCSTRRSSRCSSPGGLGARPVTHRLQRAR